MSYIKYLILAGLIWNSIIIIGCQNQESQQWIIMDTVNLPAERLAFPVFGQLLNGEKVFLNPVFAIDVVSVIADGVVIEPQESYAIYDAGLDTSIVKAVCKSLIYEMPFELTDDNKAIVFMTAKDVTDDNYRLFIYEIPVSASQIKIEYRLRTLDRIIPEVFCLSFSLKFEISREVTNDIIKKH